MQYKNSLHIFKKNFIVKALSIYISSNILSNTNIQ